MRYERRTSYKPERVKRRVTSRAPTPVFLFVPISLGKPPSSGELVSLTSDRFDLTSQTEWEEKRELDARMGCMDNERMMLGSDLAAVGEEALLASSSELPSGLPSLARMLSVPELRLFCSNSLLLSLYLSPYLFFRYLGRGERSRHSAVRPIPSFRPFHRIKIPPENNDGREILKRVEIKYS